MITIARARVRRALATFPSHLSISGSHLLNGSPSVGASAPTLNRRQNLALAPAGTLLFLRRTFTKLWISIRSRPPRNFAQYFLCANSLRPMPRADDLSAGRWMLVLRASASPNTRRKAVCRLPVPCMPSRKNKSRRCHFLRRPNQIPLCVAAAF